MKPTKILRTISAKLTPACVAMLVATNAFAIVPPKDKSSTIYNHANYTIDNGLTSNNVTTITRADDGVMWIGTNDGTNTYDGYKFVNFQPNLNDTTTISGKTVTGIAQIDEHNIWISLTDGGLSEYNTVSHKFRRLHILSNVLGEESALGLCKIKGHVFIAYKDRIIKYNIAAKTRSTIPFEHRYTYANIENERYKMLPMPGNEDVIAMHIDTRTVDIVNTRTEEIKHLQFDRIVNSVCPIDSQQMYIGSTDGLYIYNIYTESMRKDPRMGNSNIQCIGYDHSDGYWIAHDNINLTKYDPDKNTLTRVKNSGVMFNNQTHVTYITEDQNGLLWVATNNLGLFKLDTKRPKITSTQIQSTLPSTYVTNELFAVSDKEIWAACGIDGVLKVDIERGTSQHINFENRNVTAIYARSNSEVFVGTSTGALIYNYNTKEIKELPFFPEDTLNTRPIAINKMMQDCLGNIWFATPIGIFKYNGLEIKQYPIETDHGNVNTVFEDTDGRIWIGCVSGAYVKESVDTVFMQVKSQHLKNRLNNNTLCFAEYGENVLIGNSFGSIVYNKATKSVRQAEFNGRFGSSIIYSMLYDKNSIIWISTNSGIVYYDTKRKQLHQFNHLDGLNYYGNECRSFTSFGNQIFFGHAAAINSVNILRPRLNSRIPSTIVSGVYYGQASGDNDTQMTNDSTYHAKFLVRATLRVNVASDDLSIPARNEFMYSLNNGEWISLHNGNEIVIPSPSPGTIKVQIKSTNCDKVWSDRVKTIYIEIHPPMWGSNAAIIFYVLMGLAMAWLLVNFRFRTLRKKMKLIENEARSKKVVEAQRNRLAKIYKDQTDSINYAKRIQESIMPKASTVRERFSELFVLYKPKNIVSGDFYSFYYRDGKTFIIAADCTGHGVPGAFLSILGIDHLFNIIMRLKVDDAGEILSLLHQEMHKSIFKSNDEYFNDGIDLTISIVHHAEKKINFAGAMNDLYMIRSNELTVFRGDRMTIGAITPGGDVPKYTSQNIECENGDMFYMFSDGYTDQFGGPEQKKFKPRRFKHLLMNIHKLPAKDQKNILNQKIEEWRGPNEQTDDMSIIGFEPWY